MSDYDDRPRPEVVEGFVKALLEAQKLLEKYGHVKKKEDENGKD